MQRKAIDPEWMAEQDRKAIEDMKKNRESKDPPTSSERMHVFLVELNRRFEEAGFADPAIKEELLRKLRSGEQL